MKLKSLVLSFLIGCGVYGQNNEESCAPAKFDSEYFDTAFLEARDENEAWQWFLNSNQLPDQLETKEWEWEELGPTKTPRESSPSRALNQAYLGRGNGTGRVNNIYVNPQNENQIFACSPSGGLFYSENGGEKWSNGGTDQLPISGVSSVVVNPENESNWVITTGDGDDTFIFSDGVYRTFDKGITWEQLNGTLDFKLPLDKFPFGFFISKILNHPCDFSKQFVATNKGLFKCGRMLGDQKKIKWRRVSAESYYDVEVSPIDDSIILAGGENLQISENCGKSWKRIKRPVLPKDESYKLVRMTIEFSHEDEELAYIIISRQKGLGSGGVGTAHLYEFNLTTKLWKEIRELRSCGNVIPTRARAFAVNPKDDQHLIIGNVKPAFTSLDGGVVFERIEKNQMHDDIHDFEFLSNGTTVISGHDGGVSISHDKGQTWKPWDNGIGVANVHGLAVSQTENPEVLYGAYDCGSTLYKDNEWRHIAFGDGFEAVIDFENSNRMISTMQNGGLYASINGADFEEKFKTKGHKASWHTWIKQNPSLSDYIYVSGNQISRSADFGKTFEIICDPKSDFENQEKPWRFYLDQKDSNKMFVVAMGKERGKDFIYFTSNLNDTTRVNWTKLINIPKKSWVSSIVPDSRCESCHYITFNTYSQQGKMYYFDGELYTEIETGLGNSAIRCGIRDKDTGQIYLGTKLGILTKSPNNDNWVLLEGLPGVRIRSLQINYVTRELYLGTFGRGVWRGKLV